MQYIIISSLLIGDTYCIINYTYKDKGLDEGLQGYRDRMQATKSKVLRLSCTKIYLRFSDHTHCSSGLSSGIQSSFDVMIFYIRIVDTHNH